MGRRDRRVADSRDKMASRDTRERAYAGQMNRQWAAFLGAEQRKG